MRPQVLRIQYFSTEDRYQLSSVKQCRVVMVWKTKSCVTRKIFLTCEFLQSMLLFPLRMIQLQTVLFRFCCSHCLRGEKAGIKAAKNPNEWFHWKRKNLFPERGKLKKKKLNTRGIGYQHKNFNINLHRDSWEIGDRSSFLLYWRPWIRRGKRNRFSGCLFAGSRSQDFIHYLVALSLNYTHKSLV